MESQIQQIKYLNKNVNITQFLCESDEQFNSRLELIKKLEEKNIEWKQAQKLSKLYYNIKFKKCRYSPIVYNMIKDYLH
jgi:cell shape-determining protein MreC